MSFNFPTTTLETQTSGKLVSTALEDYAVVDVSGQSPPTGYKFAIGISQGDDFAIAAPRRGPLTGGPADFGKLQLWVEMTDASPPTTVSTTGALSTGEMGLQGSNIWMVVEVRDENGDPISAGTGNIWGWRLNGGDTVQAVADTLEVVKLNGRFARIIGA